MSKSFTPKVGAKKTRTTHRTSASKVSAKKAQATHRQPISQIAAEKASNTHRKEISKVATETVRGTHRTPPPTSESRFCGAGLPPVVTLSPIAVPFSALADPPRWSTRQDFLAQMNLVLDILRMPFGDMM